MKWEYSPNIEREFGIEKYAKGMIKSRKRDMTEGMKLPNQEKIRMLGEEEIIIYLEKNGSWHHQTVGNENKIKN